MATELTITIKGIESTYKQKFLLYDEYLFSENDPIIKKCLQEAMENANFKPEDIKIRSLMVIK